jgi:cytochrome c553
VADAGGSLIALDGVDLYPLLASIALAAPIASGDKQYGAFVALNDSARHGKRGVSRSGRIPALAGLDSAVIYEQVDDCRSRKAMPRSNCCIATIAGCTKRSRAVTRGSRSSESAKRMAPRWSLSRRRRDHGTILEVDALLCTGLPSAMLTIGFRMASSPALTPSRTSISVPRSRATVTL